MNNEAPCGILVVDKPTGMTSHDVVNRVRRLYGTRQVGHTGTLDPLATGVLPVLCGRAVKASEYLTAHDKAYEARFRLGVVSDSGDVTGQLTETGAPLPTADAVLAAAASMRGRQLQTPPMTSAVKIGGKKLLDYARAGQTVEVPPREIEIYEIAASPAEDGEYALSLRVSKGTYVRTVIEEIGARLGCGAVMTALRRTESGCFSLAGSHTLEELEGLDADARAALLLPLEEAFGDLACVTLAPFFARLAKSGCEIYQKKIGTAFAAGTRVRLADADGFFALGEARDYADGSAIKPIKQFRLE